MFFEMYLYSSCLNDSLSRLNKALNTATSEAELKNISDSTNISQNNEVALASMNLLIQSVDVVSGHTQLAKSSLAGYSAGNDILFGSLLAT